MTEPPERDHGARFLPPAAPPSSVPDGSRPALPPAPPSFVVPPDAPPPVVPPVAPPGALPPGALPPGALPPVDRPAPAAGSTPSPAPSSIAVTSSRRRGARQVGCGTIALLALLMGGIAIGLGYLIATVGADEPGPTDLGSEGVPLTSADPAPSTIPAPGATTTRPTPSTTGDPAVPGTSAAPGTTSPAPAVPTDLDAFCRAGRDLSDFEERLQVVEAAGDFDLLAGFVVQERQGWDVDVRSMARSGPPAVGPDVFQYALIYRAFFDAVQASDDYDELRAEVDLAVVAEASAWGDRIKAAVAANCS